MYRSFREIAEKKYAHVISKNIITKTCNQLLEDIVGEDAATERYFGTTLVVKCKNSSAAAFLKAREKGVLEVIKKFGIKTIHYKT